MNAGAWRAESGLRGAMKQSLTGRVSHLWRVGPGRGSELTPSIGVNPFLDTAESMIESNPKGWCKHIYRHCGIYNKKLSIGVNTLLSTAE